MSDEISMEDPLCDSSFGSMVTLDYVTPDTVTLHSPKVFVCYHVILWSVA